MIACWRRWRHPNGQSYVFRSGLYGHGLLCCLSMQMVRVQAMTGKCQHVHVSHTELRHGCRCRVVEALDAAHQDDCCDAGCQQKHAFHFVRVRTSANHACSWRGAAIDLKLDLHPRVRASRPEALIRMTTAELEVRLYCPIPKRENLALTVGGTVRHVYP